MTRNEAEKLALELGLREWDMGDEDGYGGEYIADPNAVEILMKYEPPTPKCGGCGQKTVSQYACWNNHCSQSNCDRTEAV